MLISAYMDESGTHGSETMIIAAQVASIRQWYWFEERVGALFADKHIKVFHAKDFHAGNGDFDGWKVNARIRFLDAFGTIGNETLVAACNVVLKMGDYRAFYANGDKPRKMRLDTAYGLCFRSALGFVSQVAATSTSPAFCPSDHRVLNVVAEQGHKNQGDALRIFTDFKADLLPQYRGLLGSIAFESREKCLPLSVSDLMAHSAFRVEEGIRPRWRVDFKLKAAQSYKKNHVRIALTPESLLKLKEQQVQGAEEMQSRGARKKRA